MTRQFAPWVRPKRKSVKRRLTWPKDVVQLASIWRPFKRRYRPEGVPASKPPRPRLRREPKRASLTPFWLSRQLNLYISGAGVLAGIETPVVVVANHQSVLDAKLLLSLLPNRWRLTTKDVNRALLAGRSVLVFPDRSPREDGELGEFQPLAAELAKQHGVAIIPVALSGTLNLKSLLPTRILGPRPTVVVRFGSPVHVRDSSIPEVTERLRVIISDLLDENQMSWWQMQRRGPLSHGADMSKWRRIWQQSELPSRLIKRRRTPIWDDAK